jgi:HEAT repeat protein
MVSSYMKIMIIGGLLATLLHSPAAPQSPTVAGIRLLGSELQTARDVSARKKAAEGLGRASTPLSVALLRRARTAERDVQVRLEIVRALRRIAFQRYSGYRDALRGIAEAADDTQESDALVRLRATEALWEAGKKDLLDPVPFMEGQFTDRSARLRMSAVQMLRKHGSVEAADALGRAVINAALSETIRLAAIDALGAVALTEGGPVGRGVVAANVSSTERIGLAPLTTPRAVDRRHERQIAYLTVLVRDPDASSTLVLRAVKSMGRIKDKSSIPVLVELVESHPHDGVRKQATRVLSHVMARQYE